MQRLDLKNMTLEERVEKLNAIILDGNILDAFEIFYAENTTMQENEDPATVGKDACRKHEEFFVAGITDFRNAKVKNVVVSDNITAVEWDFDFKHNEWGDRNYTQLSVQRWNDEGQIVNEKFYYNR